MRRISFLIVMLTGFGVAAPAAAPPPFVNYQGVLRDASNAPLSGTYDMVFRFYSASTGGDEILVDSHAAASGGAVTVSSGLFNVALGGGVLSDGAGPGTYTSLAGAFRDYSAVYLSIQVGPETLSPRVRIVSAAYALNAASLNGQPAGNYIDTSATAQTKTGRFTVNATTDINGITGIGTESGGHFLDSNGSGNAYVGYGDIGIYAEGSGDGGRFRDKEGTSDTLVAFGDYGIWGQGNLTGGYFTDKNGGSGVTYVGFGDQGIDARGNEFGGYFRDTDGSGWAKVGIGDFGIQGFGNAAGGHFQDLVLRTRNHVNDHGGEPSG